MSRSCVEFKRAMAFDTSLLVALATLSACTVGGDPHDATLKALTVSPGSLSFTPLGSQYSVAVPEGTAVVTVTPTAADPAASIAVSDDGAAAVMVPSGASTEVKVPARGSSSTVTISVSSPDGLVHRTYAVVLSQGSVDDASLKGLSLSAGMVVPTFAPATTSYTVTVPFGTPSLTVTPTAAVDGARITVAQDTSAPTVVASGTPSPSLLAPPVGKTSAVAVAVTAPDGLTTRSYYVTLGQTVSRDATLKAITLSAGTVSPTFGADTLSYTATIPKGTNAVTVTPVASGSGATITVAQDSGTPVSVASGASSSAFTVPTTHGSSTTLTLTVTAQDTVATRRYSLVLSHPSSDDATLSSLRDSAGRPEGFVGTTTSYSYAVPYQTSYTVTPTANDPDVTSITVNGKLVATGTPSQAIALTVGSVTTITIVVISQDHTQTKTYTLGVTEVAQRPPTGLVNPRTVPLSPSTPLVVATGATLPPSSATSVPVDTLLRIGFDSTPAIGTTGLITIARTTDDAVVDQLNLADPYMVYDATPKLLRLNLPPPLGTNTRANIIGGLNTGANQVRVVNYQPVLVSGNTATIFPHNNRLSYGTTYSVTIEASALNGTIRGTPFAGVAKGAWVFTTKSAAPATLNVAADNSADFATVQGAIDAAPTTPSTINVAAGVYQELLFVTKRTDLTIKGAGDAGTGLETVIQYENFDAFNPGTGTAQTVTKTAGGLGTIGLDTVDGGISGGGRSVVLVQSGSDVLTFDSVTIKNTHAQGSLRLAGATTDLTSTYMGSYSTGPQAEALYFNASSSSSVPNRVIAKHSNFVSFQDTVQVKGWGWFHDCFIAGDTDMIWGATNTTLFERCELHTRTSLSGTPAIVQARAYKDYAGFVFLQSALTKEPGASSYLARSNTGSVTATSGYDNVAYVNCAMDTQIPSTGWDVAPAPNIRASAVAGWREYGTSTIDGLPLSLGGRVAQSGATNGSYVLTGDEAVKYYPDRSAIFRGVSTPDAGYHGLDNGWSPSP